MWRNLRNLKYISTDCFPIFVSIPIIINHIEKKPKFCFLMIDLIFFPDMF